LPPIGFHLVEAGGNRHRPRLIRTLTGRPPDEEENSDKGRDKALVTQISASAISGVPSTGIIAALGALS
jgi:hypothetical protein